MHSQTPSSSSSSRSGSPDTRATTPSSAVEKSFLPQNYVYLASTALLLPNLCTIFDKYTSSGRMGLIVDHGPSPTFPTQGDWVKQSIPSQPAFEYYISSSYLPPTSSVCKLRPIILAAAHFLVLQGQFPHIYWPYSSPPALYFLPRKPPCYFFGFCGWVLYSPRSRKAIVRVPASFAHHFP